MEGLPHIHIEALCVKRKNLFLCMIDRKSSLLYSLLLRLCVCLPVFVLFPHFQCLHAQSGGSGWELVKKNNFAAAKTAFEKEWQQQPANISALTGLLFIAETLHDFESYQKYANLLVEQGWKPQYVWLFGHLYSGTPARALEALRTHSAKTPGDIPLPVVLAQADTLFKYRQFEQSAALIHQYVADWKWTLTGPFFNESGSAFAEEAGPEKVPFHATDSFITLQGLSVGWQPRQFYAPGEPVDAEVLPRTSKKSAWFANTFITVPTARRLSLRITSDEPIQIWLDDRLLFSRSQPAPAYLYDHNIVTFDMPAGTHRLLVKISEFPAEYTDSRIRLGYYDKEGWWEASAGHPSNRYEEEDEGLNEYNGRDYASGAFLLRFTDPITGTLFHDISSHFGQSYTPVGSSWATSTVTALWLDFFRDEAEKDPGNAAKKYLLAKAFIRSGAYEAGEAWFVKYYRQNPGSAYARFLLARFYDVNDKAERAEALLSEMDTTLSPTLAAHYIRLLKINKEQDEADYLAVLEKMMTLSPANWNLMDRYLSTLKRRGRKEQIAAFATAFLKRQFVGHTERLRWEKRLEAYTKDESYKPASYQPKLQKEREKEYKNAKKRLKKVFSAEDYNALILYHKMKEHKSEALKTYDEWLAIQPWRYGTLKSKAKYLFEIERMDEALAVLQSLHQRNPFDAAVLEMTGDIYMEKKQAAEALRWYKQADETGGSYGLESKIEKIENRRKYNGYFSVLNTEELAKKPDTDPRYADEESVIALLARQMTWLPKEQRVDIVHKAIVHIRTEGGVKQWTEANLRPLGRITNARVFKTDGSTTSPELGGYGSMAVFKNLQPGDVILLEGTSETPMPDDLPNDFLQFSTVSWQAPVAKAVTELILPKDSVLYFACNRLDCTPQRRDTADVQVLRWEWKHIEKQQEEDAAPNNYDAYAWLMIGNSPDWHRVVRWYERKTYCRTMPNYEVLEKSQELVRPGMSESEIVEALHTFIVREINYSYVSFLNNNYIPRQPGATLSAKVGDCKDVATLMITLLRQHGIPAWYTLVSTHNFSNTEPRPTPYFFNHAIVAWQSKDDSLHFADLTTDYFPTGVLPNGDCGAWGLVVRDGEHRLTRLPDHALAPRISAVELHNRASLDTEGNLTLQVENVRIGVPAGQWRESLLPAGAEERRKLLTTHFGGGVLHHLDLEKFQFDNLDSINQPLRAHFTLRAFHQLDHVSDLYVLPLPLSFSTPTQKSLFAAKRYNDLDLDEFFELAPVREIVDLQLPTGYVLAEMPTTRRINHRFGDYELSFEKTAAGIRIRRHCAFKVRFVHHADFADFRKFYLDMLDADDSFLALKKIGR